MRGNGGKGVRYSETGR